MNKAISRLGMDNISLGNLIVLFEKTLLLNWRIVIASDLLDGHCLLRLLIFIFSFISLFLLSSLSFAFLLLALITGCLRPGKSVSFVIWRRETGNLRIFPWIAAATQWLMFADAMLSRGWELLVADENGGNSDQKQFVWSYSAAKFFSSLNHFL